MARIDTLIDDIIKNEGGFVNHKDDKGGATNFGITIATLSDYLGREASIGDVKNMPIQLARQIYRKNYYEKPNVYMLDAPLDLAVFDICVNSGASRAGKILQEACNACGSTLFVDGKIGAKTAFEANTHLVNKKDILNKITDLRVSFYREIVKNNPSQGVFLKGWIIRAEKYRNG